MDNSFITPQSIQAVAHSIDVHNLSDEAAKALSPDVEYRLREIIQDAKKFARHGKHNRINVEDINAALRMRNFEPIYGFSKKKDPAKFVRAAGHPDVFIIKDRELSLDQLLSEPLPAPPVEISMMPHWLFINGVQPAIPENTLLDKPVSKHSRAAGKASRAPAASAPGAAKDPHGSQPSSLTAAAPQVDISAAALASGMVQVQQPVSHLLSKELQLYFDKMVALLKAPAAEAAASGSGHAHNAAVDPADVAKLQRAALESLASDPGLHPLTPYFTKWVADEIAAGLKHLPALHVLLSVVSALLCNEQIRLEHYVHQLLPPVLTCLVAKTLGAHPLEDHWSVRDRAARVVRQVCLRFSDPFFNVQPRISKTLLRALLDPSKPLSTHYGAVIGLAALGHATVSLLLIPQLQAYLAHLRPLMDDATQPVRSAEAYRVHGALLDAVSASVYERLVGSAVQGLPPQLRQIPRPRKAGLDVRTRAPGSKAEDGKGAGASAVADADGDVEMEDAVPAASKKGAGGRRGGRRSGRAGAGAAAKGKAGAKEAAAKDGGEEPSGAKAEPPSARPTAERQDRGDEPDVDDESLVQSILAESWRPEADLTKVMWALQQLFSEELMARMPLAHPPAIMM